MPFQIERGPCRVGYPGSVEEDRDLLDRRALGHALLLARVAEVQEADRQLVVGQAAWRRGPRASPARGPCASSRRARGRARRAARCRRRPRSRARPRGPARRRRSAWRWRRSAWARGRAWRREPGLSSSAAALSCARGVRAEHAEAPRVGQVVVRRPAGELEQLEQDVVAGRGRGRTPCACGGCGSARRSTPAMLRSARTALERLRVALALDAVARALDDRSARRPGARFAAPLRPLHRGREVAGRRRAGPSGRRAARAAPAGRGRRPAASTGTAARSRCRSRSRGRTGRGRRR